MLSLFILRFQQRMDRYGSSREQSLWPSQALASPFFFFFLGHSCFTMMCQFLLYNENQLYVYIYPLPLRFLSHLPPSHPSRSSQSTELNSPYYTAASHQLSMLHMVLYICPRYSLNSSHPPHHPPYPQVHSLRLCLKQFHLQIVSPGPFLEILHICMNIPYSVFSFGLIHSV